MTTSRKRRGQLKRQLTAELKKLEPDWSFVKETLQKYPNLKKKVQVGHRPHQYTTPLLHLVCEKKAPSELIKLLVDQCPESLKDASYEGKIPLHIACLRGADYEVIEYLIQKGGRETIEMRDDEDGKNALHWALYGHGESVEVIQLLVREGGSQLAKVKDNARWLPLHLACCLECDLPIVKFLVKLYPESTRIRDNEDILPIEKSQEFNQMDVVRWFQRREEERVKLTWIYKQVREWQPMQMKDCQQKLNKRRALTQPRRSKRLAKVARRQSLRLAAARDE